MPTSFRETLTYLYSLQNRGVKLGLRNIRHLLTFAGNPHLRIRTIHIAGTNGKGSTSSFIASIMMESGLKTGLYTSPHLVRFPERIRIDGKEISEKRIVDYVHRLAPAIEKYGATFFEATTCLAFLYFADEEVDVAVVETGLGGRLDATNLVIPLVSVITSLSLDHTEILGNTIASIAREKGGIIKNGVPCVTSSRDDAALRTLDRIALRRGTRVYRAWRDVRVTSDAGKRSGPISLTGKSLSTGFIRTGLRGEHQTENAQLSLRACELLRRSRVPFAHRITRKNVRNGLRRVRRNSRLRGRREVMRANNIPILLDVAHNADGVRALTDSISRTRFRRSIVLFGVMRDKDIREMVRMLAPHAIRIIGVVPETPRALGMGALSKMVRRFNIPFTPGGSVRRGLARALRLSGETTPLVILGSHYVVGEAITALGKKRT